MEWKGGDTHTVSHPSKNIREPLELAPALHFALFKRADESLILSQKSWNGRLVSLFLSWSSGIVSSNE
jgi:hypothetical protein